MEKPGQMATRVNVPSQLGGPEIVTTTGLWSLAKDPGFDRPRNWRVREERP